MSEADKLLKECGYELNPKIKKYFKEYIYNGNEYDYILFHDDKKISFGFIDGSLKLFKVIYLKVRELGWYE